MNQCWSLSHGGSGVRPSVGIFKRSPGDFVQKVENHAAMWHDVVKSLTQQASAGNVQEH